MNSIYICFYSHLCKESKYYDTDENLNQPCFPCLAYLIQEEHYFMETVELEGLSYDSDLRDKTSGFYVVLTATLKEKV